MAVEDWARAAEEVERRMSEKRLDRAALARAAGVDRKTVDNFLDRAMKPRMSTRGGYEDALGWAWGSLTDVARGQEATVIDRRRQPVTVVEAIRMDPELNKADQDALITHYRGLIAFARQRAKLAGLAPVDAGDLSPPASDPSEGQDPLALSHPPATPEPAND